MNGRQSAEKEKAAGWSAATETGLGTWIPGGRQLLVSGARPFPSQHFIRAERRPRDLQLVPAWPPTGKQNPESALPCLVRLLASRGMNLIRPVHKQTTARKRAQALLRTDGC